MSKIAIYFDNRMDELLYTKKCDDTDLYVYSMIQELLLIDPDSSAVDIARQIETLHYKTAAEITASMSKLEYYGLIHMGRLVLN